jgi:gluconate kinase
MPASLLPSQFDVLEPPTDGIRVSVDGDPEAVCQRVIDAIREH